MVFRRWGIAVGLICVTTVSLSASVVEALIGALGDPEPEVRAQAAWALGKIGAREAIPALVAALDDPEVEVVEEAVGALRELAPLPADAVQALLHLLERCDPFLSLIAISEAMAGASPEAVPVLIQALEHPDPKIRGHVALALGRGNVRGAIRPIGELLLAEEDRRGREELFQTLCYFDPLGEAIPYLRAAIEREPNPRARASMVRSMGLISPRTGDSEGVVRLLIAALEDPEVSASAASALMSLGPVAADAAPYVLELIRRGDLDHYSELMGLPKVLAAFGPRAVPFLVEALRDEEPHVRIVSLYALAEMEAEAASAVSAVMEVLHGDPDPGVRAAAASVLPRISSDVTGAVAALIASLEDPEEDVRDAAWRALCDLPPEVVAYLEGLIAGDLGLEVKLALVSTLGCFGEVGYAALVRTLMHPDPHIRIRAAAVLEDVVFSLARECPPWEVPEWACVEGLIHVLMASVDATFPEVRRAAATALAWCASEAPDEIAPVLAELLRDPDPEVRAAASMGLAGVGPLAEIALADLIAALDHPSPEVKVYAAIALGNVGPAAAEAVPKLMELLESAEDEWLVPHVFTALGRIGAEECFRAVVARLDDPDPWVRVSAVASLAVFGPAAIPHISRALEDERVAWTAVEALARVGREAVPALIAALDHPDGRVRAAAVMALGKLRAVEAVPAIVSLRHDDDVAEAVLRSLVMIGPLAKPHLEGLLASPDPEDRRFAAEALFHIDFVPPFISWAVDAVSAAVGRPLEGAVFPVEEADPEDVVSVLKTYLKEESAESVLAALATITTLSGEIVYLPGWVEVKVEYFSDEFADERLRMRYFGAEYWDVTDLEEVLQGLVLSVGPEGAIPAAQAISTGIAGMLAELVPAMEALLGHKSGEVRALAAEALGYLGPRAGGAVPVLVELLGDPEPAVRAQAAWALGMIAEREVEG